MKNVVNRAFMAKKKCIFVSLMLISFAACMGLTSCKAWRTLSSTATYTQVNDTAKVTTTISKKPLKNTKVFGKNNGVPRVS